MSATNLVYANAERTLINLVFLHPKHGSIPFTASPNDSEPSGRDLFARAVAGEYGIVAPYAPPVERTLTSSELKLKLASVRYSHEIAGTLYTGLPIDTDRESQFKAQAAYTLARDGYWAVGGSWKLKNGVMVVFTAPQVIAMALTVAAYVQACFDVEATKIAQINSTGTTNLETGWPA